MRTDRAEQPIESVGLFPGFVEHLASAGEVDLIDGFLVQPRQVGGTARAAYPDLVIDFAQLAEADDNEIIRFAAEWGMLGLCEHGHYRGWHAVVPSDLSPLPTGWPGEVIPGRCPRPMGIVDGTTGSMPWPEPLRERIVDWRRIACETRAILRVSTALHRGEKPNHRDVRTIQRAGTADGESWDAYPEPDPRMNASDKARSAIICAVRERLWHVSLGAIATHQATLRFQWPAGSRTPSFTFGGLGDLYSYLATRLVFATTTDPNQAARGLEIVVCSHCQQGYRPERRPRPDQRRFCATCRAAGEPQKYAKRDQYMRDRQKGSS